MSLVHSFYSKAATLATINSDMTLCDGRTGIILTPYLLWNQKDSDCRFSLLIGVIGKQLLFHIQLLK